MTEEKKNVKVNIFGNEYLIKGEGNEEYIQNLARYVNDKMREIEQAAHLTSPLKISILASINLADEIFRLRAHSSLTDIAIGKSQKEEVPAISGIAPEAVEALIQHIQNALVGE